MYLFQVKSVRFYYDINTNGFRWPSIKGGIINNNKVIMGDCSEPKEYTGSYESIKKGDELHFYVTFTNSVDYVKTIDSFKTTVEE